MMTIVKCGIAKYIGLPENPNVEKFEQMWKNKINDVDYNPITLLCGFLHNSDEAVQLHEKLKLSAYDRDLAYFITKFMDETKDSDKLM